MSFAAWKIRSKGLRGALCGLGCLVASDIALAAPPRVEMARAKVLSGAVMAPSDRGAAVLTLDADLQRAAVALLDNSHANEAGLVAIDLRTRRVIAWASVDGAGRDLASVAFAPPASLVKVATASALVEAGVSGLASQCYVGGERTVHLSDLRKNGAGGASCSALHTSLGYSRNMVVAGLAVRHLKGPAIERFAHSLGMTDGVPIDVQVDRGHLSIGQAEELLARGAAGFGPGRISPLGAAYMMSVLANGGVRTPLTVVDHFLGPKGERLASPGPVGEVGRVMRTSTAASLTRMLEVTVREGTCAKVFRDPTGRPYFKNTHIAGKTGTLFRKSPRRLYSWFAGFAPSRNPEVAIAVMLANDTKWWRKANEVARDFLLAYFSQTSASTDRLKTSMVSDSSDM